MSKALTENQDYSLVELLQIIDRGITDEYCHDCSKCGMSFAKEIEIGINGRSHRVWCYSYLLSVVINKLSR